MFQSPNEEIDEMVTERKMDATHLLAEDHRKVEQLFEQFEKASGDGRKEKIARQICTELKVQMEQVEHHVEEEEKSRGNLFQQARATDVDLEALGRQMAARKEELMRFHDAEGLPPAQPATMGTEA